MDKIKRASILCKRLVPVITIAIFAIILFLRNSVSADTYTFTFNGWTETFQNSGSTITTKWDPTSESYCYMTYGKTASASIKYRTKWVTITPKTVDKWTFPYENSSYWTEANHEQDVPAYNGYTYTLLSIKKETLNNILKARGCKSLEEMAATSSDSTATVYLQSSHIFLNGETPIDTNGTQGFYNYGLSWNKANALGFASGNYFTGYNVPINLKVPKKVNLYLQSYTSEAGGSTYTKIENNNRFSEASRQSSAGRNVTFTVNADVTANSIVADENGNDKVSIPQVYMKGDRIYYLQKVLVQATSSKKYPKTVKGDRGWNNKMGAVTYDNISNYAATNGSTVYHDALQTLRNTTVPTNNGSKQGNIVVRAIYTSVKRNLTVKYYEAKKSNGKYTLPTKASKTDENALAFSLGDKITIRVGATASTSTNRYVASTKYNEKFIYKAVLVDGKGTQVLTWPTTNEQDELYRASGYTKQYKEDVKALKSLYYKETSNGNYTLKLYYVPTDKAVVSINYRYLDSDGNVIATPEGLPDSLATTTARLGDTWKFSSAKKATYSQGDYYYYSYDATYYAKNGLGTTRTTVPTKYASEMPSMSTISTISNDFAALKRNESYPVYGNITITVTYRALPPDPGQVTYQVIKHFLDKDGNPIHEEAQTPITKSKGAKFNTIAPASADYNNESYVFVKGECKGSLNIGTTTDRSKLDGQPITLNEKTTMDLYYKMAKFYKVKAVWVVFKTNGVEKILIPEKEVDTIEAGKPFKLSNYSKYWYETLPTPDGKILPSDNISRTCRQADYTSPSGAISGSAAGNVTSMSDARHNRFTMTEDVLIKFKYIPQMPVNVQYYDETTNTPIRTTVLYASKNEGTTCYVNDYDEKDAAHKIEDYKLKILNLNDYTPNGSDITYSYTGYAEFKDFTAGNFSKKAISLANVCKQKITLPMKEELKRPTIVLYYTRKATLHVKYKKWINGINDVDLLDESTFKQAIGINKSTRLDSEAAWVNAYYTSFTGNDGKSYSFNASRSIRIDYQGDDNYDITTGINSIAALKGTSVTPGKEDVTVTIYYTRVDPQPKPTLYVQRVSTDGREISKVKRVGTYDAGTTVYLSALQNALDPDDSGSKNWVTNNPTEAGYTNYAYANKIGVVANGSEVPYNLSLGNIPPQFVKMDTDKVIKLYYNPNYTLTINYYQVGSTLKLLPSKTVSMGFAGNTYYFNSLGSNYLPDTVNSRYSYANSYKLDNGKVVENGTFATVKRLSLPNLSSDHVLNLYYEEMPTTYVTIYAIDETNSQILAVTDSLQQNAQRKTIGNLFADNRLGNMLTTNVLPDLSDYGAGKVKYQGKYKLEKREAGSSYDSLAVPGNPITGTLDTVRNENVYDQTANYDLYLYYKKQVNVQVVYVNAETKEIIDTPENAKSTAAIGDNISISRSLVQKTFPMKDFSNNDTNGYLVGYANNDNSSYDAGAAPDKFTPVSDVKQVSDSGVLDRTNIQGDYYVYLYYQVPYKITIHYFYNGEERTDMGKILDMTPVKNYRVPQEHVYSSLGNGSLVAWDMAGAKDVDRKLISSVQDFLNDGDAVIPNANQDTDLNLYYRYLEAPTPEPVDQSMDTTKDSDIMDDAGNLDFNSSGEIYDDASDDAVDGYSKAKTYDVARADSGIAGGDKAESAVTTLKYGYAIKYNTYTASRTFTIRIVDEIGEEIGEYSIDRSYLMNKLDYFTILKAKNYQYRNGALDVTNNTVSGDYASHLQDVPATFINNAYFKDAPRLGTVAVNSQFGGTTVCDVKYGETKQDERNPMTNQTIDVVPTITISLDTRKNPQMDLDTATEGLVSKYDVGTDTLEFTNPFNAAKEVILDSNGNSNAVMLSAEANDGDELITSIITHLPVSKTVPNSEYKTDQCKIWYKNALALGTGSSTPAYAFTSYGDEPVSNYVMNSVFVHTPVALTLDATPTGLVNQSVHGSTSSQTLVSLGKELVVSYSATAEHKGATGYKYRDYSEYSDGKVYLVFPFEILYNGTYYEANTKLAVTYDREHPENNQIVVTVPTWTKTGDATIKAFMYASNAITEDQRQHVGIGGNYHTTEYVAVGQKYVTVLGNVFDFEVYDVSDYPLWHDVFRQTNSLLFKTGSDLVTYKVGQRNWLTESNNQKAEYTLPLMEGSHPTNKNEGTLGTGYAFRFRLKTTGSMYDENDSIKITPKFYYVPKDGSSRQEVDLYYNDTLEGERAALIKVGSDLDKKNVKSLVVGDEYLGIPDNELTDTARILGTSVQNLKSKTVDSYTFSSITLTDALRTFVGDKTVPAGAHVTADELQKSVQEWYGEYYLPSKLYACAKGFDVKGYANSKGLNFSEEFWLKNGYIVVNFDIETVDDGELSLSYNAGYPETVNMFKREGAVLNKAASNGTVYDLAYGDVVFYDRSKAAEDDYRSSGTH